MREHRNQRSRVGYKYARNLYLTNSLSNLSTQIKFKVYCYN